MSKMAVRQQKEPIDHGTCKRQKGIVREVHPRAPITARLVLDSHLREDVGVLSDDLVKDLFPRSNRVDVDFNSDKREILHVAISPYTTSTHYHAIDDLPWTIIPVRVQSSSVSQAVAISRSTIAFPALAGSLRTFLKARERFDHGQHNIQIQRPIEIRILGTVPVNLDTVFVKIEQHLLRNHDDVQNKFGGGFDVETQGHNGSWATGGTSTAPRKNLRTAPEVKERLTAAVRQALSSQRIIHAGDVLPLPLPSHPITHVPPPPARISFCEPVSQGMLLPTTKIVLIQARPRNSRIKENFPRTRPILLKNDVEDEADETSNEQFYSAAEERPGESGTEMESASTNDSETEESAGTGSDAPDDSFEDMISLATPVLPQQFADTISVFSSATSRPVSRRVDGIHTPGSVGSNYTTATARPIRSGGKVFKAEGLLSRVSIQALYPRPREDEDVDSFVFVDINTLVKIGCFSGDWARVETTEEPQGNMLSSLNLGIMEIGDEEAVNWRSVKVYGLPGLESRKLRYAMSKPVVSSSGLPQLQPPRPIPTGYVPPILLNNLGNPKYIKLSALSFASSPTQPSRIGLSQQPKASSNKFPPVAKEVTLLKVSTPLSMDRALQPALFAGLRRYFESKRRILKSGDLVGISVDEGLGRTLFSVSKGADGGNQDEDLTFKLAYSPEAPEIDAGVKKVGVAWFRVGHITPMISDDHEDVECQWGGVAVIDSSSTRMVQAGSVICKVPSTTGSAWEYWLGLKVLPKSPGDFLLPYGLVADTDPPKTFVPAMQNRLSQLISAATSPRASQLRMPPVVILLRSTQRGIGKATLVYRACADLGLHCFIIDAFDILSEGGANGDDVKTEAFLKARAERASSCGWSCTALLIRRIEVLTADRMIPAMKEIVADSRVIVATTTDVEKIPEGIRSLFTHEFEITAPGEKEREGILRNAITDRGVRISTDVDLAAVAVKTAALVAGDLVDVVDRASTAMTARLERLAESTASHNSDILTTVQDIQLAGGQASRCVTQVDFDIAVDAARKNFADAIGAPKIPNVSWDDVGGLANVKEAVMETIQLPLERPELFVRGMKKRSGILFYGPPGTGKTLLAKAIATEFSLNFFSVKGPELLNMYIGESEANVRRVFQRARDARPCVVFFDELDSVAPKRGNQGDSGGVMDRIVSQLLAELDGMSNGNENSGGVFVIGATNRPDLLDSALLRPGRFDKMLYLGVSDTHEKQTKILEALTRKFSLHPDVSLPHIAETLPLTYTGADLYALCSDAMLKAITRKAIAVDEKIKALPAGAVSTAYFFDHHATPDDVTVIVTEKDFNGAQSELVASVSAKELEHFERIRRTFESVTVERKESHVGSHLSHTPPQQVNIGTRSLNLGIDASEPEPVANGFSDGGNKGKTQNSTFSSRNVSGTGPMFGRRKGRNNVGGKGKGKAGAVVEDDSDSSFDGSQHAVKNANGASYDYGDLGDEDYTKDRVIDTDEDDYIVRTNRLK